MGMVEGYEPFDLTSSIAKGCHCFHLGVEGKLLLLQLFSVYDFACF